MTTPGNSAAIATDRLAIAIPRTITVRPLPDFGDHMLWADFVGACEAGDFIDDDGSAALATLLEMSDIDVYPSDVTDKLGRIIQRKYPWATHVVWFNK